MAFLEIAGLRKRYGAVEVLKNIDIDLEKGGFLVLVGPSGCGKSTLLHMIAGLEAVTAGEIRIDGQTVNDLHPSKRDIAMVFQTYALYPNMTVAENIGFALEMRGVPRPEREAAIAKAAQLLQIEHLLARRPGQLSGGQRQRVAMGRALVREPRLFLFDEPLSNLDAKLRVDMRTEIKRLHHRTGATIVYVTHDQIEAMTLATKIAVMKDGILQQVGTPSEIYNRPANLFVADFMGSPSMNLLEAEIAAGGANEPRLTLERNGAQPITLRVPEAKVTAAMTPGAKVILGIRPEAITDEGSADRSAMTLDTVPLLVDVVEPAGSDTLVVTTLAGKEVIARLRADAEAKPGDMLPLVFNLDKAVYFDPETGTRLQ
jgi:multiple sugar transport system ATP-binding protein